MKIKTDHKWREFKSGHDVPEKVMRREFDWIVDVESTYECFIKYKGQWFHLDEFTFFSHSSELWERGWHGYHETSYSTGVVIRLSPGSRDQYQIGSYY